MITRRLLCSLLPTCLALRLCCARIKNLRGSSSATFSRSFPTHDAKNPLYGLPTNYNQPGPVGASKKDEGAGRGEGRALREAQRASEILQELQAAQSEVPQTLKAESEPSELRRKVKVLAEEGDDTLKEGQRLKDLLVLAEERDDAVKEGHRLKDLLEEAQGPTQFGLGARAVGSVACAGSRWPSEPCFQQPPPPQHHPSQMPPFSLSKPVAIPMRHSLEFNQLFREYTDYFKLSTRRVAPFCAYQSTGHGSPNRFLPASCPPALDGPHAPDPAKKPKYLNKSKIVAAATGHPLEVSSISLAFAF